MTMNLIFKCYRVLESFHCETFTCLIETHYFIAVMMHNFDFEQNIIHT